MTLFTLERNGEDVKCPYCGTEYHVSWNTDFGDAEVGQYDSVCRKCMHTFTFVVTINYETLTLI